jgi:hypothetical protein
MSFSPSASGRFGCRDEAGASSRSFTDRCLQRPARRQRAGSLNPFVMLSAAEGFWPARSSRSCGTRCRHATPGITTAVGAKEQRLARWRRSRPPLHRGRGRSARRAICLRHAEAVPRPPAPRAAPASRTSSSAYRAAQPNRALRHRTAARRRPGSSSHHASGWNQ